MRCFCIFLAFLVCKPVIADTCVIQDYTSTKPPDFSCPSPFEETLVPKYEIVLRESVSLLPKEVAPWAGILMDPNRVIQLGLRVVGLRKLRWSEALEIREKYQAEFRFMRESFNADLAASKKVQEFYKKEFEKTQSQLEHEKKWYSSWTCGLIVGAIATSVIFSASYFSR